MPRVPSPGRFRQLFRRHDLARRPSWGWEFALRFAQEGRRPYERYDGYWACEAIRLAKALQLTGDEQDIPPLDKRRRRAWHAIREAWHLSRIDGPRRWAVDALILARQSDQEIADSESLPAEVVGAYEALFFNVRDRLPYRSYIYEQVLELDAQWTGADVAKIWSFFAYIGGPFVLRALRNEFQAYHRVDYRDLEGEFFTDYPVECTHKWVRWCIQERLLPRMLTEKQMWKLFALNGRLIAAAELHQPQTPEKPAQSHALDLLDVSLEQVGVRAAQRIA